MKSLCDAALIDAYYKSTTLGLDENFINLLLSEINRRDLNIKTLFSQHNKLFKDIEKKVTLI